MSDHPLDKGYNTQNLEGGGAPDLDALSEPLSLEDWIRNLAPTGVLDLRLRVEEIATRGLDGDAPVIVALHPLGDSTDARRFELRGNRVRPL